MALGMNQLVLVAAAAKRLAAEEDAQRPLRALGLGFPDLLATDAQIDAVFGAGTAAGLPILPQSQEVIRYHGAGKVLPHVRDSAALLSAMGIGLEVVDIAVIRGGERIVDLNHPLPPDLAEAYDLVIDTGTLEHCFNVGQAMVNVASALRRGGYLVHAAPMNLYNHGFWNFSPTVYFDFFGDNGYEIEYFQAMSGHVLAGMRPVPTHPHLTFHEAPPRTAIHMLARRTEVRPIVYPVQRKYRAMAAQA